LPCVSLFLQTLELLHELREVNHGKMFLYFFHFRCPSMDRPAS
jgi:hypothetical protein